MNAIRMILTAISGRLGFGAETPAGGTKKVCCRKVIGSEVTYTKRDDKCHSDEDEVPLSNCS